jgi:hypothetical protein
VLAPTLGRAVAVVALGVFAAGGCRRDERPRSRGDSSAAPASYQPTPGTTIRVSARPDSAAAADAADSLAHDGWDATVGRRVSGVSGWPVNVTVPGDSVLARSIAHAWRQAGVEAEVMGRRTTATGIAVAVSAVNGGTHGMSARVRWVSSPDRRALLVVEDPRGVENDPLPNGFAFAREGLPVVQRDSAWDVATAPDWKRVAYSRAYTTKPGESDSVPPSEWHRLAARVGLMESVVKKNAFPTSGMVAAFGVARTFVIDASAASDSVPPTEVALPVAEGWRLAWTVDGSRLAIGAPPDVMADDAGASRWRLVDPARGESRGVGDPAALARPQWVEGPNIDVSTAVDMKQRRAVRAGEVDVESEDGWIRMYLRNGVRLRTPRIIGPGIALAATVNGEFVLAIAPDPNAQSNEPPNHLIMYRTLRR